MRASQSTRVQLTEALAALQVTTQTPMQALKGALRGEETDAEFDAAVENVRENTATRVVDSRSATSPTGSTAGENEKASNK